MTAIVWPAFALWGFVAIVVVLMVWWLRARRHPLWVIVLGGVGAAVASYVVGMVVMIAVTTLLFSDGYVPAF